MTPKRLADLHREWIKTDDTEEERRITAELFVAAEALQAELVEARAETERLRGYFVASLDQNVLEQQRRQMTTLFLERAHQRDVLEVERDDLHAKLAACVAAVEEGCADVDPNSPVGEAIAKILAAAKGNI